ncbi:DegQ family serine endoprotease [candidate division KSB1 bacterium]|nr:DegQ family serine endoprotease [candidate division KSB1 bacterium]
MRSNKLILIVIGAVFVGVIAGLIFASNMNWTHVGFAEDNEAGKSVLGSERSPLNTTIDVAALDNAFVQVAKDVKPSVVTITSARIIKYRRMNPFSDFFQDDFFRRFFEMPDNRRRDEGQRDDGTEEYRQQGLGSGVIISEDGYIITNNHVIKDADEITVLTIDNKEYTAKIVGTDAKTDVAVIKIEAKNLPAARLGDSDKVEVGQWVLAIGNPFSRELEHTVTHGIVSAKGRSSFQLAEYEDFIQTDAAINPGNSGGALVNLRGELIGINTAIVSGGGSGNVGIGFAIPVNMARHVMEMLIEKGHVVRGWLGVMIQGIDDEMAQALGLESSKGALVSQVLEDSPAAKAGLKVEDVITAIDGKEVEDASRLSLMIASIEPDTRVQLTVIRNGESQTVTVRLGEHPDTERSEPVAEKPKSTEKIGIRVENLTSATRSEYGYEDDEGVLVTYVKSGSIAFREGIRTGDLIKAINREMITSVNDFNKVINDIEEDEIIFMRLKKGKDHYYVSFKMPKE